MLLSDEFETRFVTACAGYLQWRGDRLQVKVASAGHPAQMIIRADGRVQTLRGGGMPLGMFPDAEMSTETLTGHGRQLLQAERGEVADTASARVLPVH